MRIRDRSRRAALAALVVTVAACSTSTPAQPNADPASSSVAPTSSAAMIPRPDVPAGIAPIALIAPAERGAGRAPTFEWQAVAGAATYRLVVLGPDAPRWSWTGADTKVRYGGVPEGVDGLSLAPGSWWSVAALAADGGIVGLSDLRAVSPDADPGPAPTWADGTAVATSSTSPTPAGSAVAGRTLAACDLVTPAELTSLLGRDFASGAPSGFALTGTDCTFPSDSLASLNVALDGRDGYFPDLWAPDHEPIPGLGEDSFYVKSGMDSKVGFIRGDHSVLLTFSFGRVDPNQLVELARDIDADLTSH